MRKLILACMLLTSAGCTAYATRYDDRRSFAPPAPCVSGVVFVANGSGDSRSVSANLSQVVDEKRVPLQIETVVWSHGMFRYITDHVDHDNHVAEGRKLACEVMAYRRAYPGRKVYLIGYSTGAAVVIAAAEQLPPDSADGVVLLAPSVCMSYDLRPALRGARVIDVFYSNRDRWILGVGMRIVGTADRGCRLAAGEYGFTPIVNGPEDAALYNRLRQHAWDPVVEWTGNEGGHYGSNGAGFLRAYVLPLLGCN